MVPLAGASQTGAWLRWGVRVWLVMWQRGRAKWSSGEYHDNRHESPCALVVPALWYLSRRRETPRRTKGDHHHEQCEAGTNQGQPPGPHD